MFFYAAGRRPPIDELDLWTERVLIAATLDEVFAS
ncbi:Hypothetical protein I5071_1500 (plasmid) [Sandaracinus amylolyticus]|nr:Hypothetical protein I5071_1500 [Sandaracinus amylolyticus]